MQTTWSMCLRHSLRVALAWAFFPLGALAEAVPEAALSVQPRPTRTHFALSLGHLQASAHEVVFGGASNDGEWSHLIWDTEHALTVDAGIRHEWGPRLSLHAEFSTALVDEGHMVDYDWLGSTPQWTDRSIHPDTSLDAYYRLDVGASWAFFKGERFSLAALTGFRYIDISWTARGGSYVYSTDPSCFEMMKETFQEEKKESRIGKKFPDFTWARIGNGMRANSRSRRQRSWESLWVPPIEIATGTGMCFSMSPLIRRSSLVSKRACPTP